VTNGPVFSDYGIAQGAGTTAAPVDPAPAEPIEPAAPRSKTRTWSLKSGKNIEAELVVKMGDKLVLKNQRGKTVKIPVNEFSEEDLDYVELENPPKLKLTLQKETDNFKFELLPIASIPPAVKQLTCGLKIEKTDMTPYSKVLKAELFTFAAEFDGDNYILLDRQERWFTFPTENGNTYEFMGKEVFLRNYLDGADYKRGEKYSGRMILVTDERGEIIAQQVSNPWMLENLEFLRRFPVGRHFSDEGERVHPPRTGARTRDATVRPIDAARMKYPNVEGSGRAGIHFKPRNKHEVQDSLHSSAGFAFVERARHFKVAAAGGFFRGGRKKRVCDEAGKAGGRKTVGLVCADVGNLSAPFAAVLF